MIPEWLKYEHMCIIKHEKETNEKTFHWTRIPEKMLYEAGFIHDFNKLRMQRKEKFYEKKQKQKNKIVENPIREYGIDGLTFNEETNSYNAIQCKYWSKSKYLCANELGSFYQVVYHRMIPKNQNSRGTLYYTCKLQADVRDDFKNSSTIKVVHYIPEEQEQEEEKETKEITLRPSQIENLNLLNTNMQETCNKINLFVSPCGYGKTELIMRHSQFMKHDIIIICSPLQEHSRQTLKRFEKMFPDYQGLLVDCESDGCRDIQKIHEMIKQKKVILSMTYKSALDILPTFYYETKYESDSDSYHESDSEYDTEEEESSDSENDVEMKYGFDFSNAIIYVDEAHNVNDKFIEILNNFPNKSLLVTATPPLFLEEDFNANVVCNYKMSRAIENKEICDYIVYFPFLENEFVVPEELHSVSNQDFCKKSIYLLVGMLRTGSRRNITYLNSKEECREFIRILKQVNERYFYLDIWTDVIHSDIDYKKRQEIRNAFACDETDDKLKILCNIRILSENIDIVECDSTFHTNITDESNQISIVQRMCRANRLDRKNPNKVANTFLWCDIECDIVRVLSLLKENDPNFYKKIRVMNSDYERCYSENVNEIEEKEVERLVEYIDIKCLTKEEIFNKKLGMFREFVIEKERVPKKREFYKNLNIGVWYNISQKRKIKKFNDKNLLKILSDVHECVKQDLEKYLKKEKVKSFDESFNIFKEFVVDKERVPKYKETYNNWNICRWYQHQKTNIKNNSDEKLLQLLSEIHTCVKQDLNNFLKKSFEESLNIFKEFVVKEKRVPKDKEDYIGRWYTRQKRNIKNNSDEKLLQTLSNVHECVKLDLEECLKKEKKELKSFEESFNIFQQFVAEDKRIPISTETYKNWNIGVWYFHQKNILKKNSDEKLLQTLSDVNECVKKDLEECLKKEKKEVKSFEESLNIFKEFVIAKERVPKVRETYKNCNIGMWYQTSQKRNIKNNSDKKLLQTLSDVHECVKKDLEECLKKEKKEFKSFEETLQIFKQFIIKNERVPNRKEIYKKHSIGHWYSVKKSNIKNNSDEKLLKILSDVDECVSIDIEDFLKDDKYEKKWFKESFEIFKEFVMEKERVPICTEIYNGINIGKWYFHRKEDIKNNLDDKLQKLLSDIHVCVKQNLDEYLKKEVKSFEESFNIFKEFVIEEKRVPKKNETYKKCNVRAWYQTQKTKIKNNSDEKLQQLLSNVHECVKKDLEEYLQKSFEESLNIFREFVFKEKRVPKAKESYKKLNIGLWYSNQKQKVKKNDDQQLLTTLSDSHECVKQNLDDFLKNDKYEKKCFQEPFQIFKQFVIEKERLPRKKDTYKNYNIGMWYQYRKKIIKSNSEDKLMEVLSEIHACVKQDLEEYIKKRK